MTTLADDKTPYKLLVEQASTPAPTPALVAGQQIIFISSVDHLLKMVNSSGIVSTIGTSPATKIYMAENFK